MRQYADSDVCCMVDIWNEVVDDGTAFPQNDRLTMETGKEFFAAQTYCGVAEAVDTKEILGMYILHPNNVGRCGHICNASYAVKSSERGKHIGEKLVADCMMQGKSAGFRILQFNAVVKTNYSARHLYEKLGFVQLGIIPDGFFLKNGNYEDIVVYYCLL